MKPHFLTKAQIHDIASANLVDYVLSGVAALEQMVTLNELNEDIGLVWKTPERKVHINNIIMLLHALRTRSKDDPLTGEIMYRANLLMDVLVRLETTFSKSRGDWTKWVIGKKREEPKTPTSAHEVNVMLIEIILSLKRWKDLVHGKLAIPLGNAHTRDTYHPEFNLTHQFIPPSIPGDYRSNFFFEVKVKELCPFTTVIRLHPYHAAQFGFQETRSFEELSKVDVNVDLLDMASLEAADNIRIHRMHGPSDDKRFPGSYLLIHGGHHRTRALYQLFIQGKLSGEAKIVVQQPTDDSMHHRFIASAQKEIPKREIRRKQLQSDV